MKKLFLFILPVFFVGLCFAQEAEISEFDDGKAVGSEIIENEEILDTVEIAPVAEKKERKKLDVDFRFYLPSLFRLVTGDNPLFGLRENSNEVNSCFQFMIESRFSIASINILTLSWSFGAGAYIENNNNPDTNLQSLNLSLGFGGYFHIKDIPTYPLSGLTVYLYPVYQVPVYSFGSKPYFSWKCAVDCGFNFAFLEVISIYPYFRQIMAFNSETFGYGFDFGVAVGFYFHDFPKQAF